MEYERKIVFFFVIKYLNSLLTNIINYSNTKSEYFRMFLITWVLGLFTKDNFPDKTSCFAGTWNARTECSLVPQKTFEIVVSKQSFSDSFYIDISPSMWDHSRIHILAAEDKKRNVFKLTDNKNQRIDEGKLTFGDKCRVSSSVFVLPNNLSIFGVVESGKGLISLRKGDEFCKFFVEKKLEYSSWVFSVRIFLGVLFMYIGLQTYYGWNKEEVLKPKMVPIDNPGEEMIMPEEEDESDESSDSSSSDFYSDDGF